jgi:NADPH:quinone reductase-like Zn-dependent oxidoreductase
MTALQALRDEARMPMMGALQRVLVIGASGGVGHVAVQVAKAAGARVTGVCSGRNVALVQSLGADHVIDYTQGNAWEGQGPWDIICDCVGGAPSAWLKYLQPQGFYVSCLPGPAVIGRMLFNVFSGQKVSPVLLKPNAPDLKVLDDLYVQGRLKILVDSHYPLEDLNKAWERSRSGRAVGKIVVDVIG